jgi:TonB family protein
MRIFITILAQLLFMSCTLMAQLPNAPVVPFQSEMGKWWKNSETVKKLQLSETQVNQIEKIFLDHRLTLANLNSELKIHEEELKKQMQTDPINDSTVRVQTENVLAARVALQRENSSMMLSIRKALSSEQWEKLEGMQKSDVYISGNGVKAPNVYISGNGVKAPNVYIPGSGVKAPKVLFQPMPNYTQEARQNRIEGIVLLQTVVRKDGTVDSFKVLRGLGYGLDESAINTVATRWRFEPGTLPSGQPVDVQISIEISFRQDF